MSTQIKFTTPIFHLTGDGVATSAKLSILEYPFIGIPKLRPASVIVTDGGDHIISASIDGSVIELTFDSAFSGDNGGSTISLMFSL